MSARVLSPLIDKRSAGDLAKLLRGLAPHYSPEWAAKDDDDPGVALLHAFTYLSEGVIDRLNRAPDRNFYAFLDMLGIRLLPATPARGPLRFLPATGLSDWVDVLAGAEATASAPSGPVPFETYENLRVVAANLMALVAADPLTDSIYLPPPGFLVLDAVAPKLPPHTVQAFSAAGSASFQLDFADQLRPGDVLRVPQTASGTGPAVGNPGSASRATIPDYLVVSDVKGSVVTLTDPLPRDYAGGTSVEKVTEFSLLEGKSVQQHVLYLAHSDYFTVKSEADFELRLTQAPGTRAGLFPLAVTWEYWGSLDAAPSAPDAWQKFQVEADGSSGFSETGTSQLHKPKGEIKQKEVNGIKSRWIRARLDTPLPATPAPIIPRLDSIQLRISSAADGIAPDQAFNNDTPLSLNQPYPPFGFEPRTFDRFYLGSAEGFSKPGAAVVLDVTLDTSELLGSPAAVFTKGKARVFAHGVGGVLDEFDIDPNKSDQPAPQIDPQPPGTKVSAGSIPAAVADGAGRVGAFVRGDDGNVWMNWNPTGDPKLSRWINLQSPSGSKLQFDPAAIFLSATGKWQVFVVKDGKLYFRVVDPVAPDSPSDWTALLEVATSSQPFTAASTPAVAMSHSGFLRVVAFNDVPDDPNSSGYAWVWDGAHWTEIKPIGASGTLLTAYLAKPESRPAVQVFENGSGLTPAPIHTRVFLINKSNQLAFVEAFDNQQLTGELWDAPAGVILQSSPVVFATDPADLSTVRVFASGSDNVLCEGRDGAPALMTHTGPAGANLKGELSLADYTGILSSGDSFFSVFSGSDKNTLLEFRSASSSTTALRAGPAQLIPLEAAIDASSEDMFVLLVDGPDKDSILQIVEGSSKTRFAKLVQPFSQTAPRLSGPIASGTKYQVLHRIESGKIQNAPADDEVTLKSGTAADPSHDQYLLVDGATPPHSKIKSKLNDTVTVHDAFDPRPQHDDDYLLLEADGHVQRAQENAVQIVLLADSASSTDGAYNDRFIQLSSASGTSQPLKITAYIGEDRAAILASAPPASTDNTSSYQILATALPQTWLSYSDVDQSDLRPQLSWEYWDGKGWVNFTDLTDKTQNLLISGEITFTVARDIAQTEVAGQKNYWIRSRIVGGDYGRESFSFNVSTDPNNPKNSTTTVTLNKNAIRPPFIQNLTISYSMSQDQFPQSCLTLNNLDWLDQTAANNVGGKFYEPFVPLPVSEQALFLGFDQPFEGGPVRIYFSAQEMEVDESDVPRLALEYAADNDWKPITSEDATNAFTRPDRVTVSLNPDWQMRSQFGQSLSWIRARLSSGDWTQTPVFWGIFPNTCRAVQARTITNEILGSGNDAANATFHFSQTPVLAAEDGQAGEIVRVREVLTDEERAKLIASAGEAAVFVVKDNQGKPLETWVRWNEVSEFYDSQPTDRVYRLDRWDGEIKFGDGVHGRVPPIGGDNIVAFSYRSGGGIKGNVPAKQINTLVTAIARIQSVSNPDAFGGGSDAATPEQMLVFGPAQISNRDRAVTPDDFETLAMESSRQVRKVRCVPDRNSAGQSETGWVSVYIVPDSTDSQPMPTLELRRTVENYLLDRVLVTLKDLGRIFVRPPEYVVVSVDATVYAVSLDKIGEAENAVCQKLATFLHPLTGGPHGQGWDFGRELAVSDLYAVLEDIDTVDHVGLITLKFDNHSSIDRVVVGSHQLIAEGEHSIRMDVGGGV